MRGEGWSVFYCIAVGEGREGLLPKAAPPVAFAVGHREFDGGLARRPADEPGGDEQPVAQRVHGYFLLPAEMTLDGGGEDALIVRPEATVEVRSLPPGAADFIDAISAGHTVAEAMRIAAECDRRFDLAANIAGLIEAGGLCLLSDRHGHLSRCTRIIR